jgi:hypothetical protein
MGGSVTRASPVVVTRVLEPVEVTSEAWPLMMVLKTVVYSWTEVETRGVVRTRAVVLIDDEAGADVRVADPAACVSLEGTRPVDVGAAEEAPAPLLLLVAAAEVWAGASDVAGLSEVGAGAADEAGGAALEAGGAAEDAGGAADEGAGAAEEAAAELAPVPEAWRFSLWCRYSLMPSMCRPSRLKAEAMATKAMKAANIHAWRNMVVVVVVKVAKACGSSGSGGRWAMSDGQ